MFKQSPPSFRAQYILGRLDQVTTANRNRNAFDTALLYPICTQETVEALLRLPEFLAYGKSDPNIPKRLFRDLKPRVRRGIAIPWSQEDEPLPFIRYLFSLYHPRGVTSRPPRCGGAHESYALTKAVAAGFVPLVKFLLGTGVDPAGKGAIAVMVAIQRKDLQMVRLLVEGDLGDPRSAKRRRVPDRVVCTSAMANRALRAGAQEILRYLLGKEVIVDMQTLHLLHSNALL